jgi:hypothetical protein
LRRYDHEKVFDSVISPREYEERKKQIESGSIIY